MSAPELKPCPFCGGEAVETRPRDVHCKDSGCAGYKTRHMSAEQWNARADIPAARIAELEEENARLREALEEAACYGCTCNPAYYERGLAAPDCMANLVSDDAREALGMAPVCKGSAAARAALDKDRAS